MLMTTELLVTIHDQDLILGESAGRFAGIPATYLFVGPRPVDRIPDDVNVIVARDHSPNFEHHPQFYDFTGWWAAAHHGLLRGDRLLCLQYDHQVPADPRPQLDPLLDVHPMVAFVAGHRNAGNFMLGIAGFEDTYRAGLAVVGAPPLDEWPAFNQWPSTQGTAWCVDAFVAFMEWVTPLFELWHTDRWAGHLMERMVKAWLVTTDQPEGYLPGAVVHEGRDCHGTCALMAGRSDIHAERAATFGR